MLAPAIHKLLPVQIMKITIEWKICEFKNST